MQRRQATLPEPDDIKNTLEKLASAYALLGLLEKEVGSIEINSLPADVQKIFDSVKIFPSRKMSTSKLPNAQTLQLKLGATAPSQNQTLPAYNTDNGTPVPAARSRRTRTRAPSQDLTLQDDNEESTWQTQALAAYYTGNNVAVSSGRSRRARNRAPSREIALPVDSEESTWEEDDTSTGSAGSEIFATAASHRTKRTRENTSSTDLEEVSSSSICKHVLGSLEEEFLPTQAKSRGLQL